MGTPISSLPTAAALDGNEKVVILQSGVDKLVTIDKIEQFIEGAGTSSFGLQELYAENNLSDLFDVDEALFNLGFSTGVAGSYTNANLTIDASGRITAASSGSGGGAGTSTVGNETSIGDNVWGGSPGWVLFLDPSTGLLTGTNDLTYNNHELRLGSTGGFSGVLRFAGTTSGYIYLTSPPAPTSGSYILPTAMGNNGDVLSASVAGIMSWVAQNVIPLFDHYADVGNVGAGEDDLYSDTIPAAGGLGNLANNGEKIEAEYALSLAVAATTIKAYFGGTLIFNSGSLAGLTGGAGVWVSIIRESNSVVRCMVTAQVSGLASEAVTYTRITGLTLSNTQVLKITGTGGTIPADNDIVAKFGSVRWVAKA